jgi:stage V sporulation protein K
MEKAVASATAVYAESINPLKLNGRGYGKAQEALKQQFPYYIEDVKFTPWTDGTGTGAKDKGYIKPRYIRPASAREGYFDASITGRGKISADKMNYQNQAVRDMLTGNKPDEDADPADEDDTKAPAATRRDTPAPAPVASAQDTTMDLVRALRVQTQWNPGNGLNLQGDLTDAVRNADRVKAVLGGTLDEVRAAYDTPEGRRAIEQALRTIKEQRLLAVDDALWTRGPKTIPVPEDTMVLINNLGVRDFSMTAVPEDGNVAFYDGIIEPMLSVNYNPVVASLGITKDSTAAQVKAAVKERAAILRQLQQAHRDFAERKIPNPPSLSEKDLRKEAEDLAILSTAFRLRQEKADAEKAAADAEAAYANKVIHTFSDQETADALSGLVPKADAPDAGAADEVDALKKAAAPYREELQGMVGMDDVTHQMDMLVARAAASKRRDRLGMDPIERPMNMVFSGNPGTGKTTVAENIAGLYFDLGLTKEPKFMKLTKRDLVGATANDIANTTREQLEEGRGGVILIDEAYSLLSDDYGRQVIDEIVPFITSDAGKETVLIFAGYPQGMKDFRENANPGLKSRLSTVIDFRDYSAPELVQIADGMLAKNGYVAAPVAKKRLTHAVAQMHASPEFNANGRDVENFINNVADAHDERLMEMPHATKAQEQEITTSDVEYAVKAMGLKPPTVRRKKAA